jgi:hypothetical protein
MNFKHGHFRYRIDFAYGFYNELYITMIILPNINTKRSSYNAASRSVLFFNVACSKLQQFSL